MRRTMIGVLAVLSLLLLRGGVLSAADTAAPVVTRVTEGSVPWHGYKITCPAYEFQLACTPEYGFYRFWVTRGGEKLAESSETAFSIYDDKNKKYAWSAFERRANPDDFSVVQGDGEISWQLNPSAVKMADYGGRVEYGPNRVALTHQWMMHQDVDGRVIIAGLRLGIPLLTGCPYKAVLADGTEVAGNIPAELPEKWTLYTPDSKGKSIRTITFETGKGKIRINFIPDKYTDTAVFNEPRLGTMLQTEQNPPLRRYELNCIIPAGNKDLLRTYTIVFEFPE